MTDLGDFSELAPIAKEKRLSLSMKVNMLRLAERICSRNVTMESVDCICVRSSTEIIIVDMSSESKRIIDVVSAAAVLNDSGYLALQVSQNSKDHIRIICTKSGSVDLMYTMPEKVVFWKWITPKFMGLVTETSVYHLSIESGAPNLVKMFERTSNLANNRIIDYRCDPSEKWFGVIGTAPGSPGSPESLNLVKGNMQLFSVDQQCSQALEAHAASFASFKIPGNENPSTVVSFVTTSSNAGQVTSKLCVVELGAQSGKAVFTKKTDLFFPPGFDDDFPVAMQISHKYSLIYVITKLGLLFVYDLETVTEIYTNRISPESRPYILE